MRSYRDFSVEELSKMFTLFSDNVTDAFAMKKFTKARNDRQRFDACVYASYICPEIGEMLKEHISEEESAYLQCKTLLDGIRFCRQMMAEIGEASIDDFASMVDYDKESAEKATGKWRKMIEEKEAEYKRLYPKAEHWARFLNVNLPKLG